MNITDPDDPAEKNTERQGVQVIARAAAILHVLARHPRGLSLGEIAKLIKLPRSTVQRIVDALDTENLVVAGSSAHGVRLGPALIPLAAAARFDAAEVARKYMHQLSGKLGETVDLTLFDHSKVVFIAQVTGSHRLQAVSSVGIAFSLHCSAPGKAALAMLDAESREKIRKKMRLERCTANTITDWAPLAAELDEIARSGVAIDREEHDEGICAAAIALHTLDDEIICLSIPVPTLRFGESERAIVEELKAVRVLLQRELYARSAVEHMPAR
jgi:DNA-binding IclR family transcriptional regulator